MAHQSQTLCQLRVGAEQQEGSTWVGEAWPARGPQSELSPGHREDEHQRSFKSEAQASLSSVLPAEPLSRVATCYPTPQCLQARCPMYQVNTVTACQSSKGLILGDREEVSERRRVPSRSSLSTSGFLQGITPRALAD
eukprot:1141828-Rhodomonas_salina.1